MLLRRLPRIFLVLLFFLFALLASPSGPVLADEDPPVFVSMWGSSGSGEGELYEPACIAIDSSDNIYIADRGNCRIQKFDSEGNFVTEWGSVGFDPGQFQEPWGIDIDSGDNVYVADVLGNRVQKFDSSGYFLLEWGSPGDGEGEFSAPHGLAIGGNDGVYVVDSGNYRVQKFDADGDFVLEWGSVGSAPGQFWLPVGIEADAFGDIFVSDPLRNYIQEFSEAGVFSDGWGMSGSFKGQFDQPFDLAVDFAGNIYVTDAFNYRVQKFSPSKQFLCQWGISGDGEGEFDWPLGIAIRTDGRIFVSEFLNCRVQEFGYVATMDLELTTGWNMVSVPVLPDDPSVSAVFPGVDAVYTWNPVARSYDVPDTVTPDGGYWVAVSSDRVLSVEGVVLNRWTTDLQPGWNMVGSVHGGVCSFLEPDDDPCDSVEAFTYCWDPVSKSYQYGTEICPCQGYWVAATDSCVLTVGPPVP